MLVYISIAENNWTPCVFNIFTFTSCFLFSIETQHTIGYGVRTTTEECPEAIFVMCFQSIFGVMVQAFMVGIVFAKMTRPKQRTQTLLFSKNAVICQRDSELTLMFRVGDMRKSHIIGASIRAQLIKTKQTKEGEILSQYQTELEIGTDGCSSDLFFIWPMVIIHHINEASPLYNMSASDMLQDKFEIVVILEGTVESTGQSTQARSSYLNMEILWGYRFDPIVGYNKDRQGYEIDYSKFNETTQVDTPLCSAKELAEFYRAQEDYRMTGIIYTLNKIHLKYIEHMCYIIYDSFVVIWICKFVLYFEHVLYIVLFYFYLLSGISFYEKSRRTRNRSNIIINHKIYVNILYCKCLQRNCDCYIKCIIIYIYYLM